MKQLTLEDPAMWQPAPARPAAPAALPDRDTIARALAAERGNVVRTARALGLHRNQLRRFLARHPELAPVPSSSWNGAGAIT